MKRSSLRRRLTGKRAKSYLGILILVAGLCFLAWWQWAQEPVTKTAKYVSLTIAEGATTAQVAQELEDKNIIRSALVFKYLAQSMNAETALLPGKYSVSPHLSPKEIITLITSPQTPKTVKVTIPEGYTVKQIIKTLVQKGLGSTDELQKVVTSDTFSYDFLKGAPAGEHRLEGYLFPDTYLIEPKTSAHEIIGMMLKRFAQELTPENEQLLKSEKLSVNQWVTIASMVEREAVKANERPTIASVIFNRLKINMPLQIDATIQFLLPESKLKLTYDDLKIKSPYNTYLNLGLPPGPIASPGDASLQAVLHPDKTEYLYYVAKGDGSHVFAKTYSEQLKNEAKYQ